MASIHVQQRPVTYEAMQWTGSNTEEVAAFAQELVEVVHLYKREERDGPFLKIRTAERHLRVGEWLVRDGYALRVLGNDDFWVEFMEVQ